MLRIKIDWTFVSPLLRIVSGILVVEDMKIGISSKVLFKCKVKKESGTLGFSSIDQTDKNMGIPTDLFEELRPTIDTMVHSYYHGVILENYTFEWVYDSADKTFEEWAKEKGLDSANIQIEERKD